MCTPRRWCAVCADLRHVSNVYEITGDYDISAFVNVENMMALNNLIEEIRTVQGVKRTETRMVLKKYNGNEKCSDDSRL